MFWKKTKPTEEKPEKPEKKVRTIYLSGLNPSSPPEDFSKDEHYCPKFDCQIFYSFCTQSKCESLQKNGKCSYYESKEF
jgi:hypothetical protein